MIEQVKRIWPYVEGYKGRVILAFLCAIPLAAIKAAQAYLIKPIFDNGFSEGATFDEALFLGGMVVALALINYPFRYYHFYTLKMTMERVTCSLRRHIYLKLQAIPVSFFSSSKSGELLSKTTADTTLFSESFRHAFDLIREPFTALLLFFVALYHDYQLTLAIFVVVPAFLFTFLKTGQLIRRYTARMQVDVADMTHNLSEGISGQKFVKAFGLQKYITHRFDTSQDNYLGHRKKHVSIEEHAHPLIETIGALMFGGIIVFAYYRVSEGHLTAGAFVSFIGAMGMMMDPIRKFSNANVKMNTARAAGDRVFSILEHDEEKDEGTIELDEFQDSIEFRNVSFSYGEGYVLKNFNLTIKKGERVGIVGLSGSGKSTVISLILRLYNVEEGEILVDGRNVKDYTLASLRKQFSLVSQDIFLFNDTVRENILVGQDRSEQEIENALKVSYCDEFVNKLPDRLETIIGDRGLRLSGGQAQRLTIARAFLAHSPVYLFDEATSALDNESETIVQQALAEVSSNKTVVAVAHRLSTVSDFDKIVVLKDGVKVEEGTNAELLNLGGEYSKLYELSQ